MIIYGAVAGLEVSWFWAFLDLLNQKAAVGSPPCSYSVSTPQFRFHRVLAGLSWKKAIPLSGWPGRF
jgi:hypothetical protein